MDNLKIMRTGLNGSTMFSLRVDGKSVKIKGSKLVDVWEHIRENYPENASKISRYFKNGFLDPLPVEMESLEPSERSELKSLV